MTLNWWAIVAAAIAQWLLGWAWYSVLFGKQWMALTGIQADSREKTGMVKAVFSGLVSALITSTALAYIIGMMPGPQLTLLGVVATCMIVWIGFIAATMIHGVIYERKPFRLFLINSSYYLVGFFIAGMIIATWLAPIQNVLPNYYEMYPNYCNAITRPDGSTLCLPSQ